MDGAGCLSMSLFLWAEPLVWSGYRRPLQANDALPMPERLRPGAVYKQFEALWSTERKCASAPSVRRVLWRLLGRDAVLAMVFQGCAVLLKFVGVLLLRRMVQLLIAGIPEGDRTEAVLVAVGLCVANALDGAVSSLASLRLMMALWGALGCFAQAVLRKGCVLHPAVQENNRRGDLVTLALSDCARIVEMAGIIMNGVSAPMMMSVALVVLLSLFGPMALCALGTTSVAIAIIVKMGKEQGKSFRIKMMNQGRRMARLNELLQSVRFAKFYTLEEHYLGQMMAARAAELKGLMGMKTINAMNWPMAATVPILTGVSVILAHMLINGGLPDAPDTMALLATARIMYYPFSFFGGFLGGVNMFNVTTTRLQALLLQPEIVREPIRPLGDSKMAVTIEDQNFAWSLDGSEPPTLKNVRLEMPKGELWAVVGELGSGKSSLLAALLGSIDRASSPGNGHSTGKNTVISASARVYVAQEPMVMNASVKENILFGSKLHTDVSEEDYELALEAASLVQDLDVLPAGDETEIGEKGITLSGGQKARVALARAVLAAKPGALVLLDDPLAAVDAHVGSHLFNHGIVGALAETTRVLVTNQLHFLSHPEVSKILVVDDGQIVQQGTFQDLAADPAGRFSKMLSSMGDMVREQKRQHIEAKEGCAEGDVKLSPKRASGEKRDASMRSISTANALGRTQSFSSASRAVTRSETKREGAITWNTFAFYIKYMGGLPVLVAVALGSWAFHLGEVAPDVFLAVWQDDVIGGLDDTTYLIIWMAIGCAGVMSNFLSRFAWASATIRAASRIHTSVVNRVLHCPTGFFDKTPSGQIMNRLGEDQMLVDWTVGLYSEIVCIAFWIVFDIFGISVIVRPWLAPFVIFFVAIFASIREVHRRANRETMRWWMLSKSPVFNIFEEVLSGVTTIYAFGRQEYFHARFEEALHRNLSWLMSREATNLWMEQRLAVIASFFVLALTMQMVYLEGTASSSITAVAVVNVMLLGFQVKALVYFLVQAEGVYASVERIHEFSTGLEQEPEWHKRLEDDKLRAASWPSLESTLEFQDVSVRYLPHLPRALDGLTLTMAPCEKVGVVGRTGSGKSTIMGALFRLFDLDSGRIFLGGVDISSMGLQLLRRQVTIVPQDPVLFSGDLRKNLDPLGQVDDQALWDVLRRCCLTQLVEGLDGQLSASVSQGGSNFSLGERQVLCLARALLRSSRVLCLDEATANVDPTSDDRIQQVLANELKQVLVLTIAHRLQTVMNSDRILVLNQGRLDQFDTPEKLLRIEGLFRSLAMKAGVGGVPKEIDI